MSIYIYNIHNSTFVAGLLSRTRSCRLSHQKDLGHYGEPCLLGCRRLHRVYFVNGVHS